MSKKIDPVLKMIISIVLMWLMMVLLLFFSGCAVKKAETDMVKTKRKEIIHRDYRDKYMQPAYQTTPSTKQRDSL